MSRVFLLLITLGLAACSNIDIDRYSTNEPRFDPMTFFNGSIKAEGIVLSRSDKLLRYFTADIEAEWTPQLGTLRETFIWDDGERQTRNWHFEPAASGVWLGTAEDVEGNAKMQFSGNAIHMTYPLIIKTDEGTIVLSMNDWLYQVSDNVIINKTRMTKFGIKVGEVILTMRKQ